VSHVSTKAAQGQSVPATVVAKIWEEFSDNEVKRVGHSAPLRYFHDPESAMGDKVVHLLSNGWGTCGGWAKFLVDAIKAQGIGAQQVTIRPDLAPIPAPDDPSFGYFERSIEVKQVPAQGSGGAAYDNVRFGEHAVVTVATDPNTIYDPSYGRRYQAQAAQDARVLWENGAFLRSLYRYRNADGEISVKELVNREAELDLKFTPW
jgi:hypothetical protein